jgi:hypothetical protein
VVNSVGTGSDRRMVPPFANAGEEATRVKAAAMIVKRDLGIGFEYYSDFGKIGNVLPLQQQSQQLFAVTDFKVKDVDVELGAGYGFTPGSDRLLFKAIIGYAFPVPGKNNDEGGASNASMRMGTQPRTTQNSFFCEIGLRAKVKKTLASEVAASRWAALTYSRSSSSICSTSLNALRRS